ncbi:putative uncharacterized protein FLJ40606 [Elephas maximus indicus]|uniref:putative uncharacterized protein FLJ40606 n=1 Tax=Elephas maximus indicus TaxID=99487 RepID=UPI002115D131|nr:putative uncharacterized protein FLJ40606 [Elephas maximus indicus]
MAAATETGQATAASGKRRRGRCLPASDPRNLARLAAGPLLPGALTCPERTRGDAATRSARPPVLPPPPRPPQRRCRHFVSRPGTPGCACAGSASEGPRRGRAAILRIENPGGRSASKVGLSVRTRGLGAAAEPVGARTLPPARGRSRVTSQLWT